jgi:fructose-1,6-bisphosphatase/inositol monophosphatase family enzyme/glutathione synthase/RimK-type ligase-like ATP-grasp enzyme
VKLAVLLVKHPPERKSPIMPEVFRLLRDRGAEVELVYPDEGTTDLAQVRVEHDLYVLKSGTETALSLAGALHHQGAAVLNPYPAAAALRNKVVSTRMLQAAGVPVPETWLESDARNLAPLLARGPIVVKPYRGSEGRGVRVVRDAAALADGASEGAGSPVFAQRYHAPDGDGTDLKLYVIGGRTFGVRRTWPPRTYEDKLGRPFDVSRELQDVARRCGEALGVEQFGVDVVMSEGRPWVVDMQSFPGFKGVPDAARLLAQAIHAAAERAHGAPVARLERELALATRLAREAGALLLRRRAEGLTVSEKAGGEVVTPADLEADALLRAGIAEAFPDDGLYSEETADSPERLGKRRVWIIDPLDATSNYVAGGDECCVSVGLAVDGYPTLGVVYNPARDELVAGAAGAGVTLNGVPARATPVARLEDARLEVSRKEWARGLDARAGALPVRPVASMAYKLARVACGLSDGAFSFKRRKEWGTCAGAALVRAAGGRLTAVDGSDLRFNRSGPDHPLGVVASGPRLHATLGDVARRLAAAQGGGPSR